MVVVEVIAGVGLVIELKELVGLVMTPGVYATAPGVYATAPGV